MFALLASALVGCAGAAPELPDAVLGEPTPVAAGGPFARRFADDFGLAGPPSRRRFLLSVTGLTGELAARIPAGPLNLQSDVDDLGRTVWDFEAFDLRLRPDEDPASRGRCAWRSSSSAAASARCASSCACRSRRRRSVVRAIPRPSSARACSSSIADPAPSGRPAGARSSSSAAGPAARRFG